jgi:hypothetical protein
LTDNTNDKDNNKHSAGNPNILQQIIIARQEINSLQKSVSNLRKDLCQRDVIKP